MSSSPLERPWEWATRTSLRRPCGGRVKMCPTRCRSRARGGGIGNMPGRHEEECRGARSAAVAARVGIGIGIAIGIENEAEHEVRTRTRTRTRTRSRSQRGLRLLGDGGSLLDAVWVGCGWISQLGGGARAGTTNPAKGSDWLTQRRKDAKEGRTRSGCDSMAVLASLRLERSGREESVQVGEALAGGRVGGKHRGICRLCRGFLTPGDGTQC